MPDKLKHLTDLNLINSLIDEGKILGKDEALDKFKLHIQEVKAVGRYNLQNWDIEWRKSVYKFGEYFQSIDPVDFLNILTNGNPSNKNEKEVFDFYTSEIYTNSLDSQACIEKLENYISEYPYNPEFHNTLGHLYYKNNQFEDAIRHTRIAFDKDQKSFIHNLFQSYSAYLEFLIDTNEYEKGLGICTKIIEERLFKPILLNNTYQLIILGFKNRFRDYVLLNKKIQEAEFTIKQLVAKETSKGQFKIIEILGFFTAIITFIFSTVSIGKNFKFEEAIIFNIALGITLMTFVLLINMSFSTKKVKIFDYRVLMFIMLIMSLVLIVTKFGVPIWMK
ncbi:hypothetical protein [Marinifilum fragile]|uniref:tetratricopeptide repeat protein n=1 Tax=Marinifilum fragile TaxID=570161 RepID=UPI002AAC2728|nr:hypothetical protein [Marinifilum fragile]